MSVFQLLNKPIQPKFGCSFSHFNDDEVLWLINNCGINTTYHNPPSVRKMIKQAQLWRENELDLLEFSSLPIKKKLTRPWFPEMHKKNNAAPSSLFAAWYIIALANFGRIRLSIDLLDGPYLRRNFLNWPTGDTDALVTQDLIDTAWDYFVHDLHKSSKVADKFIPDIIWRFLFWAGEHLSKASKRFEEYDAAIPVQRSSRLRLGQFHLRLLLANMGLGVNIGPNSKRDFKKQIVNQSENLIKTYTVYIDHLTVSGGRYGTIVHKEKGPRYFLDWLEEYFPELTTLKELTRFHIKDYIGYLHNCLKKDGTGLGRKSINDRITSIKNWFDWLIEVHPDLAPSTNLVGPFDTVKKLLVYPEKIPYSDTRKVYNAISNLEEHLWFLEKSALLIAIDSGQRIHEILHLSYDCLIKSKAKSGYHIYFHKKKRVESQKLSANLTSVFIIKKLQEFQKGFTAPIYSPRDGLSIRRLFVKTRKSPNILSYSSVSTVFRNAQLRVGLVDNDGNAKYTIHDLRKIFASELLSQGLKPNEIGKILHQKDPRSLFPYEVFNRRAVKVIKEADESGVLVGKFLEKNDEVSGLIALQSEILDYLGSKDVRRIHQDNIQQKNKNPEIVWPLICGSCIGGAGLTCFSDDLTCLGCDFMTDLKYHQDIIDAYLKRVFREQWKREKNNIEIEPEIYNYSQTYGDGKPLNPRLESRLERVKHNVYIKQIGMTPEQAERHLENLRNTSIPKRGRPKRS